MKTYIFRTIIEKDNPKGYHGYVPLLKGLHTSGDTIEEVKKNLKDAIKCHLAGLIKDDLEIPQEGETMEVIQTFSEAEIQKYSRSYA